MADGRLTPREIQCLYLGGRLGMRNGEIATRLNISEGRVAKVLADAYRKTGSHNRRDAYRRGVFDPGLIVPRESEITLASEWTSPATVLGRSDDVEPTSPLLQSAFGWLPRTPPRIGGTLLPVILGWTLLGLVILGAIWGLANAVYSSSDPIGRRVYANADQGSQDVTLDPLTSRVADPRR